MDYKEFDYENVFNKFKNNTILVIGDVMVDTYLIGRVERISPEAPVPICDIYDKQYKLGGASNVALNLQKLGAEPIICSVVGDDDTGKIFTKLLKDNLLNENCIIRSTKRKTTNKIRVLGENHQMLRIDEESKSELDTNSYLQLVRQIEIIIKNQKINAIIFEDYDKGIINRVLIDKIFELTKNMIPIYADPKYKNFNLYHDVKLFKPNLSEFKNGLKFDFGSDDIFCCLKKYCNKLHEEKNINKIMVTMGDRGIFISVKNGDQLHIKTTPRNVIDVSGAGDAVMAIATLMDIEGCNLDFTAFASNIAGGIVCEEVGVVTVNKDKILKEIKTSI
jgi:rfaE bifunctional protein kinase chain/domain